MREFKTDDFNGVRLTEYQGKYSIEALRHKDGKFYPVWARYQKGKDELQEKSWPVKVVLGDKETAIKTLIAMLDELEPMSKTPEPQQADIPLDEPPF